MRKETWSLSDKATNVECGKYFPSMSTTQGNPKFFNAVIDIPSKGLNELQYCKPQNPMIYMTEDAVFYAKSKIKVLISSRSSREDNLYDTNSDESISLGKKNLMNRNTLALRHFTDFVKYYHTTSHSTVTTMPVSNTIILRIFGARVLHPYVNGLFQIFPLYNSSLHTVIVLMRILYFL